ncbi:MAG: TatD family hydrolase [Candidatus Micrarchaeota archaeon]
MVSTTMFIDSHCHLTHEAFQTDVDAVIQRARAAGVEKMYCASGMLGHDELVLKLCAAYPMMLRPVIGISPHDANKVTKEQKEKIFDLIEKNYRKIAAIGEIGLDFHYFKTTEEQQKQEKLYREEIELARTLDLPVVIHGRKAEERCLDILQEAKFNNFTMHCFLVKNLAPRVVEMNGLISLPTVKSKERKYIMKHIKLESLLCETDSPYLWLTRNEPANVVEVYNEIAKIREVKIENVEEQIAVNAENFFR